MSKLQLFPVNAKLSASHTNTHRATFAAGCFWGVEEEFRRQVGVVRTAVGYTQGHTQNPTYREVCSGNTGHVEAVVLDFDPALVSYDQLLELFWRIHDPTTLNRQGPDVGAQYRSGIYYHDDTQKQKAEASRERLRLSGELGNQKIVTEILEAQDFYLAEDYHQQYVEKGGVASCHYRR